MSYHISLDENAVANDCNYVLNKMVTVFFQEQCILPILNVATNQGWLLTRGIATIKSGIYPVKYGN